MQTTSGSFQWTTYNTIVGAVMARWRNLAGASQADIAGQVGVSLATWSRIERGLAPISVGQVQAFARLFSGESPSSPLAEADHALQDLLNRGVQLFADAPESPPAKEVDWMQIGAGAIAGVLAAMAARRNDS